MRRPPCWIVRLQQGQKRVHVLALAFRKNAGATDILVSVISSGVSAVRRIFVCIGEASRAAGVNARKYAVLPDCPNRMPHSLPTAHSQVMILQFS
jgi:hypothetical protein